MIDCNGIILKKIAIQDVHKGQAQMLALRNDLDTALIIGSRPLGQTLADIESWVERNNANPDLVFLGIFLENQIIGYIWGRSLFQYDHVAEIHLAICTDHRGKGHGSRALRSFLHYLTACLNFRKFVTSIVSDNKASIAMFKRIGFREVGCHKDHYQYNTAFHDVLIFELFASALQ